MKNPELAALRTLKTDLEVAEAALLARYPNSSCGDPRRGHTEREAYANAILYLIDPLVVLLHEYAESVRGPGAGRRRALRHPPEGPCEKAAAL